MKELWVDLYCGRCQKVMNSFVIPDQWPISFNPWVERENWCRCLLPMTTIRLEYREKATVVESGGQLALVNER